MARCLTSGRPFLDREVVPSNVLLIEEEGARHVLQEQFRRQAQALGVEGIDGRLRVMHRRRLRLDSDADLKALEAIIAEFGIKVVFMGPLSQLADIDDENKAAGFNGIARSLVDIVERTGTLFVLAHHRRKPDPNANRKLRPSEFFQSSRGSSALTAAMDVGLGLDREPESRSGRLHVMGRDVPTDTILVSFDPDTLLLSTDVREVQTPGRPATRDPHRSTPWR